MAYQYETGEAANVADWFTKLEAFMIAAGWTVESGSGTQTVVFKSIGEGGTRTKLHCRFRQDGVALQHVYYRVQDDVAGTHGTTEGAYAPAMDAGGAGVAPFDYWMVADRDCVNVSFLTGGAYTGSYVGIVERFAVNVAGEEYEMGAFCPTRFTEPRCGYVLRKHDGTWDKDVAPFSFVDGGLYDMNPLDNSYMVAGICVKHYQIATQNDEIIGQLKHVSCQMASVAGLNAQDTIVTEFGGATSWWTVLGTLTKRWALHTGGTLPTGAWEGGFSCTTGVATDMNDLNTKFKAFLVSKGWSEVANPSPDYPIDYYLNSPGQLGGDDIWVRWRCINGGWNGYIMDDDSDSHHTAWMNIGGPVSGDYPLNYFVAGDGDCFITGIEKSSIWYWAWFGMFTMYMGDPASIDTVYKVGCMDGYNAFQKYLLRSMDGDWLDGLTDWTDKYYNSSPNKLDGTSYIVWPRPMYSFVASGRFPIGQPKYLHRLSGTALAINDTVTVGPRRYMYIGDRFAYRDT